MKDEGTVLPEGRAQTVALRPEEGVLTVVGGEGTRLEEVWMSLGKQAKIRPPLQDLPDRLEDMVLILRLSWKHHVSMSPPLKWWFSPRGCTAP